MNRAIRATTVRLAMLLVCLLLSAATSGAQNERPASGPTQTTIAVHGRWTIDLLNPDGSLAEHHEFNNALDIGSPISPGGNSVLAGLLGKFYRNVVTWRISLHNQWNVCTQFSSVCQIDEHGGTGPPPLGTLSVHVPTQSALGLVSPVGTVELRGSMQATNAGSLTAVQTELFSCRTANCPPDPGQYSRFTRHNLATPIAVAAGQLVQVTVVISFS